MTDQRHFAPAIPIARPSVVLGTTDDGEPVAVASFVAERATRVAVIGEASLPKLIALRALASGARVQVVTSQPGEWCRVRGYAQLSADRLAIVRPGTAPPAAGTRAVPAMIIDDTGADPASGGPWQALVAVPVARAVTVGALRGFDLVVLHRSSPACRGAAVGALALPVPAALSLHGIPRDVVAVASPGVVRLVPLKLDSAERALLLELGSPIWRTNDCRIVPGPIPAIPFNTPGTGLDGEVA